jgi:hypothetical protein
MIDIARLDAVRQLLRQYPEYHDQQTIACGTTGCVAGWTTALERNAHPGDNLETVVNSYVTVTLATKLLGLSWEEQEALFFDTMDFNVFNDQSPEENALELIDALIAREKGELNEYECYILDYYNLSAIPSSTVAEESN